MSRDSRSTHLPPSEPGKFLVGNVDFKPEIPIILKLWRKHGDLITLKVFGQTIILVCGHQTLTEVLEKNGEITAEHPVIFAYTEYFESSGVLGAYGQVWKNQRKFVLDTFRKLDSGSNNLEARVTNVVADFLKDIEVANGQPIDLIKLFKTHHYNIVASLLFGEKFKPGDEVLTRLVNSVDEATYNVSDQALLAFFEWLKYLPWDQFKVRRQRYLVDEILKIVEWFMDGHKKTTEKPDSTDFIYSFIEEQERRKQDGEDMDGFQDRDMLLLGFGLLFGGVPVIQALPWSFLYLIHYPDVVSKMQKEIDDTIGRTRLPTLADRPSLPYCQAVIYEVLRMASVISAAPTHVLSADLHVNEYTLPKDAWIMFGLCTINWDPSIFPEPDNFDPSRFINEEGQLFGYEKVNASFSIGPRSCAAQTLAKMEMFLFITSVVQRYDISNEPEQPLPSLDGTYKGTHIPSPYKACLRSRE